MNALQNRESSLGRDNNILITFLNKYALYVSLLIAFAFYVRSFFPGYLTPDSIYILDMATGRAPVSNWHPPFYVGMMRWLEWAFQHAEMVWLAQIVTWIAACFYLAQSLRTLPVFSFWLLVLFPPVAANMAALWKDDWAVIATALSLSFAIRNNYIICIIFSCTAFLIRNDYIIIVLPIFSLLVIQDLNSRGYGCVLKGGLIKRTLGCLVIFGLAELSLSFLASPNVEIKNNPWIPTVAWDIAGVAVRHKDFSQVKISDNIYDLNYFLSRYNCDTSDALMFSEGSLPLKLPNDSVGELEKQASNYRSLWWWTITSDPAAYFHHRLCIIKRYLGISGETTRYPYPFESRKNEYLGDLNRSPGNYYIYSLYDSMVNTKIWKPYVWILISLLVIPLIWRTRFRTLSIVLASMSLASAARGMILPGADTRYGLWMFAGGAISVILPVLAFKEAIGNRIKLGQLR